MEKMSSPLHLALVHLDSKSQVYPALLKLRADNVGTELSEVHAVVPDGPRRTRRTSDDPVRPELPLKS